MRYPDCQHEDGDCAVCPLSSYGRDCRSAPINQVAHLRSAAGREQN